MKAEVSQAIEELMRQFDSTFAVKEDGNGGAVVIIESVDVGGGYIPSRTWIGFKIPAQYPYADIYPVFMSAEVRKADGVEFSAPVTRGHVFEGRPSIQISRRCNALQNGAQRASAKILKILDFLRKL